MRTDITVAIIMPVSLKNRIDKIVEKRMTNFSQVVREATSIGLERME